MTRPIVLAFRDRTTSLATLSTVPVRPGGAHFDPLERTGTTKFDVLRRGGGVVQLLNELRNGSAGTELRISENQDVEALTRGFRKNL